MLMGDMLVVLRRMLCCFMMSLRCVFVVLCRLLMRFIRNRITLGEALLFFANIGVTLVVLHLYGVEIRLGLP
jgi:hypothetical protein